MITLFGNKSSCSVAIYVDDDDDDDDDANVGDDDDYYYYDYYYTPFLKCTPINSIRAKK